MEYKSNLHRVLCQGGFAVTAEIGPPKGSNPSKIKSKAGIVKDYADSFNVTDNQTAVVRLSSFAGSCILIDKGLEPIMQISCRDRNRIALQSDVLGASAVGIKNILFITGDHQSFGNHPSALGVFDVDCGGFSCDDDFFRLDLLGYLKIYSDGLSNTDNDSCSFRLLEAGHIDDDEVIPARGNGWKPESSIVR